MNATADACTSPPDLVEVLVFSMVDMSRAKASTTRLLELARSSLAVVSSYSSGSTPDRGQETDRLLLWSPNEVWTAVSCQNVRFSAIFKKTPKHKQKKTHENLFFSEIFMVFFFKKNHENLLINPYL